MSRRGLIRRKFPAILAGLGLAGVALSLAFSDAAAVRPRLLASTAPSREVDFAVRLRPVRVLIESELARVSIGTESGLLVCDERGRPMATLPPGTRTLRTAANDGGPGFRLDADPFSARELLLTGVSDTALVVSEEGGDRTSSARWFPGLIRVRPHGDDRFDLVNEVEIEAYVASVVSNEVWPTFDDEAFRAQAIAARTYVVYQMARREQHSFDVAATQGSQVYRGLRQDGTGRRAASAVEYTRGVVCTFGEGGEERVFCAYYSAACGGLSQPASIFGADGDIAPLAGGVPCDFCKIAPAEIYRWGPVRLSKAELARRLEAKYPEVEELKGIRRIDVLERAAAGRPTVLRILGLNGQKFDLLAERFRHAVGPAEIRSTDFHLRDQESHVIFENGRGFGHGLGLCQWGAQGQARHGRHASDILRYYYPGAKLTKAY